MFVKRGPQEPCMQRAGHGDVKRGKPIRVLSRHTAEGKITGGETLRR